MTRRTLGLLLTLVLSLLVAPLAAEASQGGRVYRVAVLHLTSPPPAFEAFRRAMHDLGWMEGQMFVINYWGADVRGERFDALAAEIVQSKPDVIVTGTSGAAAVTKQATSTIPIVMASSVDPVGLGVVTSLARPGGNITGQAIFSPELSMKRLEILKEAFPAVSRVALFWNAAAGKAAVVRHLDVSQRAAQALGLHLHLIEVLDAEALEAAFQEARQARADAVVTIQSALFYALNGRLAELGLKYRLPMLSAETGFAEAGGLMNYGDSIVEALRRSAAQVHKIFKGAKPADLPVEQSTTFELVINLKTAKALGLTIPPALLFQADEVLQ
jgi:putative tryptophan/tyrosine transport system substrate-binding protein